MRLLDFYIDGFGIFHNVGVKDLSPKLNLFIGDNEAGKSTLLAFFRAVLFGFESKTSKINQYLPLSGGNHGGQISIKTKDNREFLIKRTPGGAQGQITITPRGGETPSEESISEILKGVTKDLYRNVFAFSLDELQDMEFLQNETISSRIYSFGASAGKTSAIDIENRIDKKMKELFTPRGEVKEINNLLYSLNQTSKKIEEIEKSVDSYDEHRRRLQEIEKQLETIDSEIAAKRETAEKLKLLNKAKPVWEELEKIEKEAEMLLAAASLPKTASIDDIAKREDSIKYARESLYSNHIPLGMLPKENNLPWERIKREININRIARFILIPALLGIAAVIAGLAGTNSIIATAGVIVSAVAITVFGLSYHASKKRTEKLLEELASMAEQCAAARNTIAKLDWIKSKLTDIIGKENTSEIMKRLAAEDESTIAYDAERADEELTKIEQSSRQMYEERGRLKQEIESAERSDNLAKELQQREELKTELNEKAEQWAIMAIAKGLLKRAREKYEKEKQPRVITEAIEFIKTITCGAYSGIYAPIGKKTVYIEQPNGLRKTVTELSRGTREQLYLALRFGLIREYGTNAEPLPIIMDDILVNFDPKRADAATQAIADLAESNQILFFTCHPETIARFKKANPSARYYTIDNLSISEC